MKFNNKTTIVTGSGQGIGKDLAIGFALEGADVVICDIDFNKINEVVDEIKSLGKNAYGIKVDVTNDKEVQEMVNKVIEKYNKIDILINNAGVLRDKRITSMTVEDWDAVIDVCLKGSFLCSKYVAQHMIDNKYGKIVNMSSRAYLGNPGQANYSSAKAGILGLTNSLAKELGKYNITVNAIAPGLISTKLVTQHPKFEKIKELQIKQTPIKRIGETEDVKKAVMFFASDDSEYITGDVLHVSGGRKG